MVANHFDSTFLGTLANSQGPSIVVAGTYWIALGRWVSESLRGLSLCLGNRYSLALTPATCPSSRSRRDQRHRRWMPGVVVTHGTVGVC
jgi:hypothetical protein